MSATNLSAKLPVIVLPLRLVLQFGKVKVPGASPPVCADPPSDKLPLALTNPDEPITRVPNSTVPITSVPVCVSVSRSAPDDGKVDALQAAPPTVSEHDVRCQLPSQVP